MNKKVWLEVALNGPWTKKRQPNIPMHPDEIIKEAIECVNLGASIIHYHGYDPDTGVESLDVTLHEYIIDSIKSEVDVIIYPGILTLNEKDALTEKALHYRYQHIPPLATSKKVEWMVVDPGTSSLTMLKDVEKMKDTFIYINSNESVKTGMDIANEYRVNPSFAIYEPGYIRLGNAFYQTYKNSMKPIYRFMFTNQFSFGYPPTQYALNSYLELLNEINDDANWMVAGLGVDIEPLVEQGIKLGGHIRTGLEDYLLGTHETNKSLTERTVALINHYQRELASPEEIRAILKQS